MSGAAPARSERRIDLPFYALGVMVCGVLLLTAAMWFFAQQGAGRTVAAATFAVAAAVGVAIATLSVRTHGSSLRQDPGAPGNRTYWRLLVGAVVLAVFDEALAGVPIFGATGFMAGLIGAILVTTLLRASGRPPPGLGQS